LQKQIQIPVSNTITRTLKTASLIDAFWERWLAHGLDRKDLEKVRSNLETSEGWFQSWEGLAKEKELVAKNLEREGNIKEAEYTFRQTALYYNLNYWLNPMNVIEKCYWYDKCLHFMSKADSLSKIITLYRTISIDDHHRCSGRIRIPSNPKGCIIIVVPIDSSKEELFKYEMEFVENGFITISFDGPGQGETFLFNEVVGTRTRWEKFIHQVIEFTSHHFSDLPIYLFGISLGASWVIYGSSHKKVKKAVAVSPAVELEKMNMPAYFMQRMDCSCIVTEEERAIPKFNEINFHSPILVFHGNKDAMVPNNVMYELFEKLSTEKKLIEYEDEGHCCNNKLDIIRQISLRWFSNEWDFKRGS
jgi:predicted esterase